jgi:hypothetical protein
MQSPLVETLNKLEKFQVTELDVVIHNPCQIEFQCGFPIPIIGFHGLVCFPK